MKLISIEVDNFWSYKHFNFNFDKKLCLVEGVNFDERGSNGSGKSALLNAVCFALFGQVPKKVKVDEVINSKEGSDCLVKLTLEEEGVIYRIIRGRKPNVLQFEINGQLQADTDLKKTQNLIEKKLGVSFDTFVNSVYFYQNSSNFLSLPEDNKKQILTEVLDFYIFDKSLSLIKIAAKKVDDEIIGLSSKETVISSTIKKSENQINDFAKKEIDFEKDKSNKLIALDNELQACELDQEKTTKQFEENKNNIVKYQAELELKEQEIEKEYAVISVKEKQRNDIEYEIRSLNSELEKVKRELNRYTLGETTCPKCFQSVNQELLNSLSSDLITKQSELLKSIEDKKALYNQMPNKSDLYALSQQIGSDKNKLTKIVNQLKADIDVALKYFSLFEERRKSIDERRNQILASNNPYMDIIQKLKADIGELLKQDEEIKNRLNFLKGEQNEYNTLKEVFSNKGIKAYVFDSIINELNIRVAQYLTTLFDSQVILRFVNESKSGPGGIKQVLTTYLTIEGQEVSLGRLSGGEERRISFAVNLALAEIIANRAGKSFNVMFFDEVFDGLDSEGKTRCMNLLCALANKRDCILVIDHLSEFQALFNNVVRIEKRNGISAIK